MMRLLRLRLAMTMLLLSPLLWRGAGGEVFAQQNKIDSLLSLLKTDKEDTNKVLHLNRISKEYINIGEYDKGLVYCKQALVLAQNLEFKKATAQSLTNIGEINWRQGN